ncbi:MAG: uroporphyrinogen-III synthase [Gammaproteobacteria bacterium]|jgi:uroporphyrinogen-III synthase
MMNDQSLDGITVLVTRPEGQIETLATAIEAQGGTAINAPMLVISPLVDPTAAQAAATALDQIDIAIFVSKNAAEFGMELLNAKGASLDRVPVFAVGLGTRDTLNRLGLAAVQAPATEFSSEGLLKLETLQQEAVDGRRVVIFRGVGGREVLAKTLERRGAEVRYCECYERQKPDVVLGTVLKAHDVRVPDVGLATSLESLTNLVEKIEEEGIDRLFDMQMLVVGSRVGQEVESLGFTQRPLVVENPSDESILRRLIRWADEES